MKDGAFISGKLEMPSSVSDVVSQASPLWEDILLNRILALIAVILVLVVLADIVKIFPKLLDCVTRWRACISLEHSLSDARPRNTAAAVLALLISLLLDKYEIFHPDFADAVSPDIRVLLSIGAVAVFFLLRAVVFRVLDLGRMRSDERNAVKNTLYSFVIVAGLLMLGSFVALEMFKAPAITIRITTICEIALFWVLSLLKTGQILRSRVSGLTTFLYLCALEILPAAAVVVCQTVL